MTQSGVRALFDDLNEFASGRIVEFSAQVTVDGHTRAVSVGRLDGTFCSNTLTIKKIGSRPGTFEWILNGNALSVTIQAGP